MDNPAHCILKLTFDTLTLYYENPKYITVKREVPCIGIGLIGSLSTVV